MSASEALILSKEERICSKKLIDRLFGGGLSHSMAAFPLRVVYLEMEQNEKEPLVQILVSVPKRCFKRAVKRNRVKRQVREAYRYHKKILTDVLLEGDNRRIALAFVWLDDKLYASSDVEQRVVNLLERVSERL
ncbi:MAG: ribonuclease P protein component [Prevotella sp.]|nr:ribonuclease P protein component [Prevotella sp.]